MTASPKAFVIGWPINHSRSPIIHRYWLARAGLAGSYDAVPVPVEEFEVFLRTFKDRDFVGGNVTLPHKESAFRACARKTDVAARLGAVNTLWLEDGELCGDNTDAHGFSANLDDQLAGWRDARSALVLGAGGAARAVIHSLLEAGVERIALLNRTVERAADLARHFGPRVVAGALADVAGLAPSTELFVNTISAGLSGEQPVSVDWSRAPKGAMVADIVYVPLLTPFLQGAKDAGFRVSDGLGMLLHQAAPGFERWFGGRPEVTDELRRLVLADIERR
ncbi:shikimate dehydrogenase [Faunimonas pinastri]|uniref:Shikimate dehydrogenase (NADP(+)) n=1 Tax=Faunimonas pinastri TaxID=1855383 RepID=A0A1H9GWU7_9HYPH|nr:shikimate dehydrogenase [Faunimonas pinastri]SEQ54525.1 shikimate dehydrogenase [Faunimonas pinastri]